MVDLKTYQERPAAQEEVVQELLEAELLLVELLILVVVEEEELKLKVDLLLEMVDQVLWS